MNILVSVPPDVAPREIMRRINGRRASRLFEEFSAPKKRYWDWHLWARGYLCAKVGEMAEAMIALYPEHHFDTDPAPELKAEP